MHLRSPTTTAASAISTTRHMHRTKQSSSSLRLGRGAGRGCAACSQLIEGRRAIVSAERNSARQPGRTIERTCAHVALWESSPRVR